MPKGHVLRDIWPMEGTEHSAVFQEEEILSVYMKGSRVRHGWKLMGREVAQAMRVACAKVWSSQKA